MNTLRFFLAAGLPLSLAGCGGQQSALDSAGPQAAAIESAWWLYFSIVTLVYVAVIVWIIISMLRMRPAATDTPQGEASAVPPQQPHADRPLERTVGGLVLVTVVLLFCLLFKDYATGQQLQSLSRDDELSVRITAHQWWWEVQYLGDSPHLYVTTANELHLPVGRPVRIELRSTDVIHSLAIPNLHGKRDLIPGYPTETHLRADREGVFWGQCAEFCGAQHANMRLLVQAESPEKFNTWLESQRQTAREPTTAWQRRGRDVFLGSTCLMCHTVLGTTAGSISGPDLTHVGSRLRLAAGTIPNGREELKRWIKDPQRIKPGVRMPLHAIPDEDLDKLAEYLESLK